MTVLLWVLLQADGALQKTVEKLVAELGASGLEARQEAEAALKKIGERAYPFLAASAEHPDPEIRGRVRDLIRFFQGPAKVWDWALPDRELMRFPEGRVHLAGGKLLVAGRTAKIQVLDLETGAFESELEPFPGERRPYEIHVAAGDGAVYATGCYEPDAGRLCAMSLTEKKTLWSVPLEVGRSPPVLDARHVYLLDRVEGGHRLQAHDRRSGKVAWSRDLPRGEGPAWHFSTPALAEGRVFAGDLDSGLYAFDAESGRPLWKASVDRKLGQVTASGAEPPLAGWGIVVSRSCADSRLVVVDAADGRTLWDLGNSGSLSSVLGRDGLYVVQKGAVERRALRDGARTMSHPLPDRGEFVGGPGPEVVGERGGVYYLNFGSLKAVDAASGAALAEWKGYGWSFQEGGWTMTLLPGHRIAASGPRRVDLLRFNPTLK